MIEADRADHSRAKLDHDLIVPITSWYHYRYREASTHGSLLTAVRYLPVPGKCKADESR